MTLVLDIPDSIRRLVPEAAVDFERMRRDRLERARQAMADAGLDVLMLGTGANIQYVSGARRLWHAGNMPFSPSGVLVRETGDIYLLSFTTDGIPDDIPASHLCPVSWDPRNLLAFLGAVREIREASRIGVDGMTPFFANVLPQVAPKASVVSAEPALRRARSIKSDDEVQCMRIATRIAEETVATTRQAARPGVTPRELRAIAMERMTAFGATIPGHDGLFAALPRDPEIRLGRLIGTEPITDGDHVALAVSVMFAGYEGNVGRTSLCGDDARKSEALARLRRNWDEDWQRLRKHLKPGAALAEIQAQLSALRCGGASFVAINGIGIGMEPPLLHSGGKAWTGPVEALEPGMALTVESYSCTRDLGGHYRNDTVIVTKDGCQNLSRLD